MKNPETARYIDVLTEPMLEVLDFPQDYLIEGETYVAAWATLQSAALGKVQSLDWPNINIPNDQLSGMDDSGQGVKRPISAEQKAEEYIILAFDDTFKLLTICEKYMDTKGLPEGESLAQILKRSDTLLLTGNLNDKNLSKVMGTLKMPSLIRNILGITIEGDPVSLSKAKDGTHSLKLHDDIRGWIKENQYPHKGCPAVGKIVHTGEGQKTTLMKYFWNTVVDAMYPENPTEQTT